MVKIYNIKALYQHKSLIKFQKNLIQHIKYYANHVDNEESQIEFKLQLKETLEIFIYLYEFYTYNEYETIKYDFIDIFKNCSLKLLNPDIFQKWFDKDSMNFGEPNFKKRRKQENGKKINKWKFKNGKILHFKNICFIAILKTKNLNDYNY